jgi:rSAM/selenodomain-associated transferase 2
MKLHPTLSVVIPTLNAETALADTIQSVQGFFPEIIIADGGSTDETIAIAHNFGAKIVMSEKGRGRQLRAGGKAASGDWLLFLHADTRLTEDWNGEAFAFMTNPHNTGRAAVFTYRLDDPTPPARRVERLVAWRTRSLGLPFGDQGLLISRAFYDSLGGFRDMPLMEDIEIIRQIGKRRLAVLQSFALTSADKYQSGGWWARPVRNVCCQILYFLGIPPSVLVLLYR